MIFIKDYLPPGMGETVTDKFKEAICDAQNSNEEKILVLEDRGIYTITETLQVEGLTILGNGSKLIFDFPQPPGYVAGLQAMGTLVLPAHSLERTAVKRTNHVECSGISSDGLESGDIVMVHSDKIAGANIKMGETKRVRKYEDDKVYFDDYLFETYELGGSSNGRISKINSVTLKVYDLEIEYMDTDSTSLSTAGIEVFYGRDIVISGVKFFNAKVTAIRLYSCYNSLVDNCEVDNSNLAGLGYGVMIGNGCSYPTVRDSKFLGTRHAIRTGGLSSIPGMQWEVSLENVIGDVNTIHTSVAVYTIETTTGSAKIKNCTAINGLKYRSSEGVEIEYTDWVDMSYDAGDIVAYKSTLDGIYRLYIATAQISSGSPDVNGLWQKYSFTYGGIGVATKGDIVIENFKAIGLSWGVRTYPIGEDPDDTSLTDKANLVIKNMYAENVRTPFLMGGGGLHRLDSLTIDGLTATSYENWDDYGVPAITISGGSINKWNFNNIKCYNKRLMFIQREIAPSKSANYDVLPEELIINNSSLTFSGKYSVLAPSTFLIDFIDATDSYLPVKTVVFNNLKTDGSRLFYIREFMDGSQEDLFFKFSNCVFLNIPISFASFETIAPIRGVEFNNCVYEPNGEPLIKVGSDMDYIGLTNNIFLGSQSPTHLINNPTSVLNNLFHSGNYLDGNMLINNSASADLEYGDT
jgi:hypothetical protein